MSRNGSPINLANARAAREAGLVYVSDESPGITRRKSGKNFIYLDTRGTNTRSFFIENSRTPTDYDLNLSVSYNATIGPVTVTPQVYLFNVLNRQTVTAYDTTFNPGGSIPPTLAEIA